MLQNKSFKLLRAGVSIFLLSTPASSENFYAQKPRGFMWYTNEPLNKKADTEIPPGDSAHKTKPVSKEEAARQRNDALKQKLNGAIQVVLDNPTLDNAIAAQRMQKLVMDRSTDVSKAWVLAALLDAGLVNPDMNPNVLHQEVAQKDQTNQTLMIFKEMAKEWGLFFYVMDRCVYCKKFVPIVKDIQDEIGFQVLAISADGKNYGPFEGRKDTGLFDRLNPEGLAPVLYLVHQDGKRIYPVARGLTDAGKIKRNILLIKKMDSQRGKRR